MKSNEKIEGKVEQLCGMALDFGADAACAAKSADVVVESDFVDLCKNGCPSYGLSPGCPPHSMNPDSFRASLNNYSDVVLFRIDAAFEDLGAADARRVISVRVHGLAAGLERKALEIGFLRATGLAAGSCRELFCSGLSCPVLDGSGLCRKANEVRPSVSAHGIDVADLCQRVGWELSWGGGNLGEVEMGMLMGLLFVG